MPKQSSPKIDILTYLVYEDLFEKSGDNVEKSVQVLPILHTVTWLAYINMFIQTTDLSRVQALQGNIAKKIFTTESLISKFSQSNKIIFCRDTILKFITQVINSNSTAIDFSELKAIETQLLVNSAYNNHSSTNGFELERSLIRNLSFMQPLEMEWTYKHCFLRYLKIYNYFVTLLSSKQVALWKKIEDEFESRAGMSIQIYMNTIKELFTWYLISRNNADKSIPGFDSENSSTFYIKRGNFTKQPTFISCLEVLAKDNSELATSFKEKRSFELDNEFFKYFPYIFDNPIYKIDNDTFCILDLAYLLENACGGLLFKLFEFNRSRLNGNIQELKGLYGNLLDSYFGWLINEIFDSFAEVTGKINGKQDALIRLNHNGIEYILVLEFTTKYYRFPSLYNLDISSWNEDIFNMFFNSETDGKFVKLNTYVENIKSSYPKAVIIPILVTEKYIGDYDLINRNNTILDQGIKEYNLNNLITQKPLIMDLNDFETFWAGTTEGDEVTLFLKEIREWSECAKGQYLYRFAHYTGNPYLQKRMNNVKYLDQFNINNIFKEGL